MHRERLRIVSLLRWIPLAKSLDRRQLAVYFLDLLAQSHFDYPALGALYPRFGALHSLFEPVGFGVGHRFFHSSHR